MNYFTSRDLHYSIFGKKNNCFDYFIIGGGIIGCSTVSILSKYKKNICLVEKNAIGSGATMLSAGTIWSVFDNSIKIKNFSLWKPIFTRETINIINNLELKKYSTGWKNCGSLSFVSPENRSFLFDEYDKQKKLSFKVELVDKNFINEIFPYLSNEIDVGIFSPLSGYVNPQKFLYSLKKNAEYNNVIIKENEKVISIRKIPWYDFLNIYNYEIKTNKNNIYYSKDVILSCGVSKIDIVGLNLENYIVPVKGHIIMSKDKLMKNDCVLFCLDSLKYWNENNTLDKKNGIPLFCSYDYENKMLVDHFYGRTQNNGKLLFGFGRIKTSENDYKLNKETENDINNFLMKIFPSISFQFKRENHWTGIMPFPIYGKPIIDNLSKYNHPNLWITNGFGPSGIMCGPGAMKFFVEWIINGKKPNILNQFKK